MPISKQLFKVAAGFSFAVTIFQVVVLFSPAWSLYFGAPAELVSNELLLWVAGLIAAVIFAVFGLYALAGAGYLRSLPLLRPGLLVIGGIYILRGLESIPQLLIVVGVFQSSASVPLQSLVSSLVSLFIGLIYLTATLTGWQGLRSRTRGRAVNKGGF